MPHFFATSDDLLPLLSAVESKFDLRYTMVGHHPSPNVEVWTRGADLPSIHKPSLVDSSAACPAYLVTPHQASVVSREIRRDDGSLIFAVDQRENPESVVFAHGGRFGEDILLHGRVSTASRTPGALKLQRAFESAIRKQFVRIRAFYVGKAAEALLDNGFRLTMAAQSPAQYDLSR